IITQSLPSQLETMIKPLTDKLIAELATNSKLIEGNVFESLSYLSNFPLKELNKLENFLNKTSDGAVLLTKIITEFKSQVTNVNSNFSDQIAKIQEQITAIEIDKTKTTY